MFYHMRVMLLCTQYLHAGVHSICTPVYTVQHSSSPYLLVVVVVGLFLLVQMGEMGLRHYNNLFVQMSCPAKLVQVGWTGCVYQPKSFAQMT